MNTENPKVECKSTQLISILSEHLAGKMNLARIKFFGLIICAMYKVQTVCFEKLSTAFESQAKANSSLRRIQRFFAKYKLPSDLIAQIIFKLLPHKPPYRLAMDRTNWQFGETDINVLTLAVVFHGVAIPLLMLILDKRVAIRTHRNVSKSWKDIYGFSVLKPWTAYLQTVSLWEINGLLFSISAKYATISVFAKTSSL
jgi:hypothetical protein